MVPSPLTSILLVEDSEDDLFFFRRLLNKAGVDVPLAVATDGQQAIDYLKRSLPGALPAPAPPPRLVFLDLKLPLKGGFEVLQWVRAEPALSHVVVVVLSSSAEARDVARAFDSGAQGYLVKHPPAAAIAELVRRVQALAADAALAGLVVPDSLRP